jgi:uncharacterized membrane protein
MPDPPERREEEIQPAQPHLDPAEEVTGELVEDPKIRRAIEVAVQQNIEAHLHLREKDLLPDADELKRFDQIVPGLAARVADEWQAESKHRREMDREIVDGQLSGYRRYQWFAFVLILALIGASVYLFTIGQDVIAFLLALTTAASVIVRALLALVGAKSTDDESNGNGDSDEDATA